MFAPLGDQKTVVHWYADFLLMVGHLRQVNELVRLFHVDMKSPGNLSPCGQHEYYFSWAGSELSRVGLK